LQISVPSARKHAYDPSTFAQQVLAFIEELCPELVIEATISVKRGTHEAAAQITSPRAGLTGQGP